MKADTGYSLYCDGACWGNPGLSSGGSVIFDSRGREVFRSAVFFGKGTNNTAEYGALIEGLEAARRLNIEKLNVYTDSELVVKQLNGSYRVKAGNLKALLENVEDLGKYFTSLKFIHLKREFTEIPHKMAEGILKERA